MRACARRGISRLRSGTQGRRQMATKVCKRCGVEKPLEDFYKCKNCSDRRGSTCKDCTHIKHKEYYQKNREKLLVRYAEYREAHREELKQYFRDRYKAKKPEILAAQKEYNKKHREEKVKYLRAYYRKNKERLTKQNYERQRARLATDSLYKLKQQMSLLTWRAFDGHGQVRRARVEKILGCSPEDLTAHLKQTWADRYGEEWTGQPCHIDHITPLHTARTPEDVYKLCHYANLQLLTPEDNMAKGKTTDGKWEQTNNSIIEQ